MAMERHGLDDGTISHRRQGAVTRVRPIRTGSTACAKPLLGAARRGLPATATRHQLRQPLTAMATPRHIHAARRRRGRRARRADGSESGTATGAMRPPSSSSAIWAGSFRWRRSALRDSRNRRPSCRCPTAASLVAGGAADAEVYEPATRSFAGRAGQPAMNFRSYRDPLRDGYVLVVGGYDDRIDLVAARGCSDPDPSCIGSRKRRPVGPWRRECRGSLRSPHACCASPASPAGRPRHSRHPGASRARRRSARRRLYGARPTARSLGPSRTSSTAAATAREAIDGDRRRQRPGDRRSHGSPRRGLAPKRDARGRGRVAGSGHRPRLLRRADEAAAYGTGILRQRALGAPNSASAAPADRLATCSSDGTSDGDARRLARRRCANRATAAEPRSARRAAQARRSTG